MATARAVPAPLAQQTFTLVSGLAGAMGGLLLATRLIGKTHVRVEPLMLATLLSAGATFGAVYLIRGE
jgi:hypothetical protein